MKIGIITFHRAHNYGAVLQCYSLCENIKRLGHDVEVIDFLPTQFRAEYSIYPFRHLSWKHKVTQLLKLLPILDIKIKRRNGFNKFIENLPLSKKSYDESNICTDHYDDIVFGSDQIWNPTLLNNNDSVYCGNFQKGNTRFVAYAASTNPKLLDGSYFDYFSGIIKRFDRISAREQSLTNYLNRIQGNVASTVLDPVLLNKKEDWARIAETPKEKNYLLIYTVPQHPDVYELANRIAKEKKLDIIEIRPNVRRIRKKGVLQTVSPSQFVGYFLNASFVITTSFHGTAFSVVMHKDFYTLSINPDVDDRVKTLLTSVNLLDRLVSLNNICHKPIDWEATEEYLDNIRKESIEYLNLSLMK